MKIKFTTLLYWCALLLWLSGFIAIIYESELSFVDWLIPLGCIFYSLAYFKNKKNKK